MTEGPKRATELGWNDLPADMDPTIYHRAFLGPEDTIIPDGVTRLDTQIDPTCTSSNSIHELGVQHIVETVGDLVEFWREAYRVCNNGTTVRVYGAYYSHIDATANPLYRRGLSERMFSYLSPGNRAVAARDPYADLSTFDALKDVDFEFKGVRYFLEDKWRCRSQAAVNWHQEHSLNVVRRIEALLIVHKPVRKF